MSMKKVTGVVLAACLTAGLLSGCSLPWKTKDTSSNKKVEKQVSNKEDTETKKKASDILSLSIKDNYINSSDDRILVNYDSVDLSDPWQENYPELETALTDYTAERKKEAESQQQQLVGYMQEYGSEDADNDGMNYSYSERQRLVRADGTVTSLVASTYSYAGGAHPSGGYISKNFDSVTGKEIAFKDVVKDGQGFGDAMYSQLQKAYPDLSSMHEEEGYEVFNLKESLPKRAKAMIDGTASADAGQSDLFPLTWVMTYDGIRVYFSDYEIASYAEGMQAIDITYQDYPDVFQDTYSFKGLPDGAMEQVASSEDKLVEPIIMVNGKTLSLNMQTESDTLSFTYDGQTCTDDQLGYYFGCNAYVLHRGEDYYLYCDLLSDNDWHFLNVYNLNTASKVDGAGSLGMYYGAYSDAKNMVLGTRLDILGTISVYSYYTTGSDGLPVMNEASKSTYYVGDYGAPNAETDEPRTLTVKKDFKATDGLGKSVTLKAGTVLTYQTVDQEATKVGFSTQDGDMVYIDAKYENGGASIKNGKKWVNGDDYLDGIQFAG